MRPRHSFALAAAVTCATVAAGVSATQVPSAPVTVVEAPRAMPRVAHERPPSVSRGDTRPLADPQKIDALDASPGRALVGEQTTERRTEARPQRMVDPSPTTAGLDGNRALGYRLMLAAGFDAGEWEALEELWARESGWNHLAKNESSGAYGIPQSLPGTKMAAAGSDWRTNPATQIEWGLGYIRDRYGTPRAALAHSNRVGWY